jgi:glycosyltransferase involved in cell wall biosynthesis
VHQVPLEFLRIKGSEAEVLSGMLSCRVFLSLNLGKDPLWGEGCPRTIIEALSTGCVVIAFDTVGNLEMIHSHFNGILVPRYRPDKMGEALIGVYLNQGEIERLSTNALSLIRACHTLDARWPAVKEFLELPG